MSCRIKTFSRLVFVIAMLTFFMVLSVYSDETERASQLNHARQILLKCVDAHEEKVLAFFEDIEQMAMPEKNRYQNEMDISFHLHNDQNKSVAVDLKINSRWEPSPQDKNKTPAPSQVTPYGKMWTHITGDLGEVMMTMNQNKMIVAQPKLATYMVVDLQFGGFGNGNSNRVQQALSSFISKEFVSQYLPQGKDFDKAFSPEPIAMEAQQVGESEEFQDMFKALRKFIKEDEKIEQLDMVMVTQEKLDGHVHDVISFSENNWFCKLYISNKSHLLSKISVKSNSPEITFQGQAKVGESRSIEIDVVSETTEQNQQNSSITTSVVPDLFELNIDYENDHSLKEIRGVLGNDKSKIIDFKMNFAGKMNGDYDFSLKSKGDFKKPGGFDLNVVAQQKSVEKKFNDRDFEIGNFDQMNEVPSEAFMQTIMFGVMPKLMEFQQLKSPTRIQGQTNVKADSALQQD